MIVWFLFLLGSFVFVTSSKIDPDADGPEKKRLVLDIVAEKLMGLRLLVPLDWIYKSSMRSLCSFLLLLSLVLWMVHGLLYSQLQYYDIVDSSWNDLYDSVVVKGLNAKNAADLGSIKGIQKDRLMFDRHVPYVYYPSVKFWEKESISLYLESLAIPIFQGSLTFLSLVTLRPVIYILSGNDLSILEDIFSTHMGYKLFWYGACRIGILSLFDLMKLDFSLYFPSLLTSNFYTSTNSDWWDTFNEYLVPFDIDHRGTQKGEILRQEKLAVLKRQNPRLYDQLMQFKSTLDGTSSSLGRPYIHPFVADALRNGYCALEIVALCIIISVLLYKLFKWRKLMQSEKDREIWVPDTEKRQERLSNRPRGIIKSVLGVPLDPESSEDMELDLLEIQKAKNNKEVKRRYVGEKGMQDVADGNGYSDRINSSRTSSTSTSATTSLGGTPTPADDTHQQQLATIYGMQDSGTLSRNIRLSSHTISLLASLMFSLLGYGVLLVLQSVLPLIIVHQGLLTRYPIVADLLTVFKYVLLMSIYGCLVGIIVPNSGSSGVNVLREIWKINKKLEERDGIEFEGLECLFFRLDKVQRTLTEFSGATVGELAFEKGHYSSKGKEDEVSLRKYDAPDRFHHKAGHHEDSRTSSPHYRGSNGKDDVYEKPKWVNHPFIEDANIQESLRIGSGESSQKGSQKGMKEEDASGGPRQNNPNNNNNNSSGASRRTLNSMPLNSDAPPPPPPPSSSRASGFEQLRNFNPLQPLSSTSSSEANSPFPSIPPPYSMDHEKRGGGIIQGQKFENSQKQQHHDDDDASRQFAIGRSHEMTQVEGNDPDPANDSSSCGSSCTCADDDDS